MRINLSEFITSETASLMEFAKIWREKNQQKPEIFPLEQNEWGWLKQYYAFQARKIEEACLAEEKAKKAA